MPITMTEALSAWRAGNDAGNGYAPYSDEPGEDSIDMAVEASVADGGEVVLERCTSSDIAVVRMADGGLMGIGGDATGRNAWAVDLDPHLKR